MIPERLTKDRDVDRSGHEFRYHLAAGFCGSHAIVLDAACGTGYGARILQERGTVSYIGLDVDLTDLEVRRHHGRRFFCVDLTRPDTWRIPDLVFDVFVGFETMEHLDDWRPWRDLALQATSWILVSVPVVPTVGVNPHHVHDFESGEVPVHFIHPDWSLYQTIAQPSEHSEVYVFQRRR